MDHLSTKQKVVLAIALPASVVLLYLLFKKKDDNTLKPSQNLATGQRHFIEMRVPYDKVGRLIGREGCNIKKIQADSGAHVKFLDETNREDTFDRHLKISGNRDSALLAETMIMEFLAEQPEIIAKVLMIPQQAVGRIIGHQGKNIRKIQTSSKAKVQIDRSVEDATKPEILRRCVLQGTLQQIHSAEYMIREEIADVEDYQQRLAEAAAKRRQRPTGISSKNTTTESTVGAQQAQEPQNSWHAEATSVAEPPSNTEFFTVYVSAVEHPEHFWLQMVNSKARQLDLLLQTMTEFYDKPENKQSFAPGTVRPGDIIAAPFSHDESWYRARVLGLLEEEMLDVYYVDYGDCSSVSKDKVCLLRSDFLSLAFQAVEFCLAGVAPLGAEWSEEAIICFEELTSVAQWRPLMARIVDYRRSETGTIPCVELFDTTGNNDINIAVELRFRGFAKSVKLHERPGTTEMDEKETNPRTSSARGRDSSHDAATL